MTAGWPSFQEWWSPQAVQKAWREVREYDAQVNVPIINDPLRANRELRFTQLGSRYGDNVDVLEAAGGEDWRDTVGRWGVSVEAPVAREVSVEAPVVREVSGEAPVAREVFREAPSSAWDRYFANVDNKAEGGGGRGRGRKKERGGKRMRSRGNKSRGNRRRGTRRR